MTISIAAKSLVAVGAYHNKEPRVPFDQDAPDGFQITVGNSSAWLSEEEAVRLGRYLLDQKEAS
jgi:hypothetical protein